MLFGAGVASASPGAVVSSFGTDGSLVATFGPDSPPASGGDGVAVAPNGDIYESGVATISGSGGSAINEVYIARYLPTGVLDSSFGTGGVTYENVGDGVSPSTGTVGNPFEPTAFVALTPSGDPVVATEASATTSSDMQLAVLEFTSSGTLNTAFNSTGVYKINLGTSTVPGGLAVQGNGDIVITGGVETGGGAQFFAERLTSGGTADSSFGSGGVTELSLGPGAVSEGFGVIVQSDGDLVFGGTANDASGHPEFAITRLTASGQPDNSFGTGGTAYAQPSSGSSPAAIALDVTATPDGGYAATGLAENSPSIGVAVVRLTNSGGLDTAFSGGGMSIITTPGLTQGLATGIFAQNDGKLLLTGTGLGVSTAGPMAIRLNTDGTLDNSFGSGGVAINNLTQPYDGLAMGAAMTADGNMFLTGLGEPTGAGGTGSFLQELNLDTAPTVSFIYAPTTVKVGTPVQFAASAIPSSGEAITGVSWDFGSGKFGAATGANVKRTFSQPGRYTVRVQATDGFGLSTISSRSITVIGPSLKLGSIAVASSGLEIKLSCKKTTCDVNAALTTVEHLRGKTVTKLTASGHGKHTKLVKIGSAKFKISAGKSETLMLKLNARGEQLLGQFHALPTKAAFELTNGKGKTVQRTVTIR